MTEHSDRTLSEADRLGKVYDWPAEERDAVLALVAEAVSRHPRIDGYCPMGCGKTLFLADGGGITCSLIGCPDPLAVDTILADREHEHVVEIGEGTFTVRHPLRERVGEQLMDCDLHNWLASLPGPPARPGRFRAYATHGSLGDDRPWRFEAIGSAR